MCIRRVWDAKPSDLSLDLYKRISKSFPHLKRLILYGLGEPFINPSFLRMLKIARSFIPEECRIIVSTNGSLLKPQIARKILKIGIDSLSFSIDTADPAKLGRIREGSTLGCFYTKTNEMDCYINEPGCSECIYSVKLAQCNI